MREPQFLACLWVSEAQLMPDPNPSGIAVGWMEGEAIAVKIQIRQATLATKTCATRWKRNRRQGHHGRAALEAGAPKLFILEPKRRAS